MCRTDDLILVLFIVFMTDVPVIMETANNQQSIKNGNCDVTSTDNLIKYGQKNQFPNGIPKIVHYVYKTAYIPSQYSPHVQQCMRINNDTKFVFWTDFIAYRFIIENYPEYRNLYGSYFVKSTDPLTISDLIRYFLMLKFGGIYMDLDTNCLKPFTTALMNESCVLSREVQEQTQILYNMEYLAMNSLMMCTPGHDFFRYILGKIKKPDGSWVVSLTGPVLLTNTYKSYMKELSKSNRTDLSNIITVADAYKFSPFFENYIINKCNGKLHGNWKIQGCKNIGELLRNQRAKMSEAVVVHLFMHLGYGYSKGHIKVLENVCLSFPAISLVWF